MKFPKAILTPGYTQPQTGAVTEGTATVYITEWERLYRYNRDLENYLCECVAALLQNNIMPPEAPAHVETVLREKTIAALKGE